LKTYLNGEKVYEKPLPDLLR